MNAPTAFVTGADRGLGLGFVRALLDRGFRVLAGEFGLDPSGLDALACDRLRRIPLDVGSDASVRAAADRVRQDCPHLDLLVNNAAILGDFTATLADPQDFDQMLAVYNVNALGPLRVAQALFTHLERGGLKKLVNISSEAGSMMQSARVDRRARYGYCMSKAALNVQTVILNNDAKERGIDVYLIDPGWIRTFMHGERNTTAPQDPEDTAREILTLVLDQPRPPDLYTTRFGERYDW